MKIIYKALSAGTLILFLCLAAPSQSQDSHPVSINISSCSVLALVGGNLTLTVSAPAGGGQPPQSDTDSTCYIHYTSCLPTGQTRTLSVAWGASDSAPSGCALQLTATPSGTPGEGSSAGQKTVTSTAQTIITGVSRCATGTSATDGANLSYTLSVSDAASLQSGENTSATITFTLTDAS